MTGERRKFRREGEERRRDALIAAALDLVSEGGPEAATVRAIAERAGVTPGLIRHYFRTKEDLTRAAYRTADGPDDRSQRARCWTTPLTTPRRGWRPLSRPRCARR